MWRLSVLPSTESGARPADVLVHARPDARVRDLAAHLAQHLTGDPTTRTLLAPVTDGGPWPADRLLTDCGLRSGDVIEVASVPRGWLAQPGTRRRPRAVVEVLSGPDAGLVVEVHSPSLTLGRAPECTVRLSDPLVSRVHARVVLAGAPVLSDEGSAHGTRVEGREVGRPVGLRWGQPVELGATRLVLREGGTGSRYTADDEVAVLRPPRFGAELVEADLDVPAAPQRPRRRGFPWPMMLMPVVLGATMYATTRSSYSLALVVAWPLMLVVGHLVQGRQADREHAEDVAAWKVEVQEVLDTLDAAAAVQRARAAEDDPEPAVVRTLLQSRDRGTWARRPGDPDFLALRVGRGPVPAVVTAHVARGGDRTEREEVRAALAERTELAGMPVLLPVGEHGLVAVTGPAEVLDDAVRAVLLRLAATHSPHEVGLAAVLAPERAHLESWLRWLPHTARRPGGAAAVAVGATDGAALLEQLSADATPDGHGHTVCLLDEGAGLTRRSVEAVAASALERRLHLVWCGASADRVPAATAVHVDLAAPVVQVAGRGGRQPLTSVDALALVPAWQSARTLTTFRDDVAVVPADTALPDTVRLPELSRDLDDALGGPDSGVDAGRLVERWRSSRGLRAQIGAGVDGVVTIDLREDGPHGLVAGTTGSGKSELLQTLICSLAVNNPPSRITFLLVDYKGGAAFRECAELPHSVGMITDLTPALVQRALVSLHAELTAREGLLARYGAKDLVALEREHPDLAPPSLLIVVDEFAALTAEVPEFVDGMVSIAQRGRSLGMHMLLATQRPAGVVTPQIKANTDLRIALRVSSPDDSTDVIDTPDAARLSRRTPGRAWLRRTGHGTCELVQAAWVGAREEQRAGAELVDVAPFTSLGEVVAGRSGELHARSDLDRTVGVVAEAVLRAGISPPRRPWLPPLPDELGLAVAGPGELLLGAEAHDEALVPGTAGPELVRVSPTDGQVLLGTVDRPARQSQSPLLVDLARSGHLLVYGTSGSGKTEVLRTLAVSATAAAGTCPPVVYGIDCGGGGLGVLAALPSVGSIVVEQQLPRVLRMIRMLHRTITDRNAALAAAGAGDVGALAAAGQPLPRIHLLVDNLPGLLEALEGGGSARRVHAEHLVTVLQEGRRCGVHVSATSPHRTGVPSTMASAFGQRLVLRMTVADDYAMLGAPDGVLDAESPAGRGLLDGAEVQVATTGGAGTAVQGERLRALAAVLAPSYADRPAVQVPAMPSHLPGELLPPGAADTVSLGVDAELAGLVQLDLLDGPLLVAGRARSGRTGLLRALARAARGQDGGPAVVVALGPRAAELAGDVDLVLDDPVAALDWAGGAGRDEDGGWTLLLVDDAHEWERGWEAGGAARELLVALAAVVDGARAARRAVVLVTDPDESRTRGHLAGPVSAVRRARRGLLLAPESGDGSLLGVQVPMQTHEPLTGPGRGILCTGGGVRVVQVISAAQDGSAGASDPLVHEGGVAR